MKTPRFAGGLSVLLLAALFLAPFPLAAQEESCTVLCSPELKFEPTVTVENVVSAPRIAPLEDGVPVDTVQTGTETAFEVVFALDVPSEIPRVGFTFEAIWTPFAETGASPFTGRTADELGVEAVADNPVELEAEANVTLLTPEETGGRPRRRNRPAESGGAPGRHASVHP